MKQAAPRPLAAARAVVIHGQAQARLALAAAAANAAGSPRLVLLSAPGAANFMGPGWWLALLEAVRPQMQAVGALDQLDCGGSAGRAMEALRLGLRRLILSADCPQFAAVEARAAGLGAALDPDRPEALDLGDRGAERRLRAWLRNPAPDLDAARPPP